MALPTTNMDLDRSGLMPAPANPLTTNVEPQSNASITHPASVMVGHSPEDADALKNAISVLSRLYNFRRQYDRRRAIFYRQYIGQRDQRLYPDNITPRSNTFVPYPYSSVGTVVDRTMDAFFNFAPWFECTGRGASDDDAAEKMGLVLDYLLGRAGFINAFELFLRNLCIYGHAGIKVDWDHAVDMVTYPEPDFAMIPVQHPETGEPLTDPQTGQPQMQPMIDPQTGQPVVTGYHSAQKPIPRARPRFIVIDVFDLLVDPDGGLSAHVVERTYGQLKQEYASNPDLYLKDGMDELARALAGQENPDEVLIRIAELWNEYSNKCTILTFSDDAKESISYKDLRAAYRGASISSYKRRLYNGPSILLWHGDNQFAHRRSPILSTSFLKLPNEIFGLGLIEIISDISEAMNRFVNMIVDNWNLGINSRMAYDVNADIDHQALNNFNVPGGKVGVNGNPSQMLFPLPSFTPKPGDYQILDVYRGMLELASGISDFYGKGVGKPTNNKTATGIAQVINESNYGFKRFIRNVEIDILQPMLQMCASMVQQFLTDPIEVRITDQPPQIPKYPKVDPEELIGTFDFRLVAANYATNKVVRQRNLMAFVNIVGQSPYWRQYEGLKEMARVFEIPNVNRLLKTPQEVQQEQVQQVQAQIAMQKAQQEEEIKMMILQSRLNENVARAKTSEHKTAPSGGGKVGRPGGPNVRVPGAGTSSATREIAQNIFGANKMGLEGLGETGGGQ